MCIRNTSQQKLAKATASLWWEIGVYKIKKKIILIFSLIFFWVSCFVFFYWVIYNRQFILVRLKYFMIYVQFFVYVQHET